MSRGRGENDNVSTLRQGVQEAAVINSVADAFNAVSNPVPAEVRENTVLMARAGSASLGTATADSSDQDFIAVYVEPKRAVFGLDNYEYWEGSTSDADVRKGYGDVEIKGFGLKKFVGLSAKGNPDVLAALYSQQLDGSSSEVGKLLVENRRLFSTKHAGRRYAGYMKAQMKRLMTEVGMKVKRPELTEKYGYDVKYAYHVLRLGQQGIDFMNSGELIMPLPQEQIDFLMGVRTGKYSLTEVQEMAEKLDQKLMKAVELSTLPEEADRKRVNELLLNSYELHFYGKQ